MQPDDKNNLARECANSLGLTLSEIYAIARTAPKRYKVYPIEKKSGGYRIICQPSRELKALQYFLLRKILQDLPVHQCATAYRVGGSIRVNAEAHKESRILLKLDFSNFFNSILVGDWRKYVISNLPSWSLDDFHFSAFVMFWGAGGYRPECLSIGAPSSPHLSNVMMWNFDEIMFEYARENRLIYTRYADDITISSKEYMDVEGVKSKIVVALDVSGGPKLALNEQKTYVASKARARRVTGLILSAQDRVSMGRDRKRLISSMLHHALTGRLSVEEQSKLRGLLAFANDVEPTFLASLDRKYGLGTVSRILSPETAG